MTRRLALLALALMVAACGPGSIATTQPQPPSSSVPAPGSTTTVDPPGVGVPTLTVWGSSQRLTRTGAVRISGTVSEPAVISISDGAVLTDSDQWWADLELEPGAHEVVIAAEDVDGNQVEATVDVVVDPSLEEVLAYIGDFDGEKLMADVVEWFTGDEATAAAREDGVIGEGETVPNDFYIRNSDPSLVSIEVAPTAPVVLQTCFIDGPCVVETPVDLDQWARLLAEDAPGGLAENWQWYGGGALPYWLVLSDGVVVQVTEQYLP